MKPTTIPLSFAALLMATGAQGQTEKFSLSETFGGSFGSQVPVTITGTFTGDRNGNIVSGLNDINLFLDGAAFSGNGHLHVAEYNPHSGLFESGGQLSFDNTENDALFINIDHAKADNRYASFFYSFSQYGDGAYNGAVAGWSRHHGAASSHLTIKEVGAIPEPATWAMMLAGFAMMGAGLRYRRKSVAAHFA